MRLVVLAIVGCIASATGMAIGDDLAELSDQVRTPSYSGGGPSESRPCRTGWFQGGRQNRDQEDYLESDDMELDTAAAMALCAAHIATVPLWGPAFLLEDSYAESAFFPRYPNQQPHQGYLMIEPDIPLMERPWGGRCSIGYGENFDEITAVNGRLMLESSSRFGFDSETRYVAQRVGPGRHDSLWISDINANFRFAQSERFQMRFGIGGNLFYGDQESRAGFNLTYGADWFPARPWIVSADLDWGQLGHASLFHALFTVGLHWHHCEAYSGYDYLDVGYTQFNSFVAGIRFWF
jgi:hypothetical protein